MQSGRGGERTSASAKEERPAGRPQQAGHHAMRRTWNAVTARSCDGSTTFTTPADVAAPSSEPVAFNDKSSTYGASLSSEADEDVGTRPTCAHA